MPTTLITGANKGLGLETARRLLVRGHDVWLAARDHARGLAAATDVGGRFVELDVTSDDSVRRAPPRPRSRRDRRPRPLRERTT